MSNHPAALFIAGFPLSVTSARVVHRDQSKDHPRRAEVNSRLN
jgi:hypothetical protein